jgi:HlyD family secretion protein
LATNQNVEDDLMSLKIPPDMRSDEPRTGPHSRGRTLWALAGAVAAAIVIFALMNLKSAVLVEVERAQVVTGDVSTAATLIASGYVVPHHQVEVGTKVMGKVAWIGVEKGDKVKTGQVLVRLEDSEYRAQLQRARGQLATAQANYDALKNGSRPEEIARDQAEMENARATYDRVRQLAAEGIYNQQQLDDAKSRYQSALNIYQLTKLGPRREQIEQAQASVEQARGDVAYAQTQLDATRIIAPIDGTILDRVVEKGELVTTMFTGEGAKSYVVSLADLNDLRVELDINQNDFSRISRGQPCDVVLEAYPTKHYRGQVIELSPEANREKGTVQVKVQFLKTDDNVRPQMLARVSFEQPAKTSAAATSGSQDSSAPRVTIARFARVTRDGRDGVFVIQQGRAKFRAVQLTDSGGDRLVVTQGVQAGEQVVLNASEALKDGSRVKVKSAQAGNS